MKRIGLTLLLLLIGNYSYSQSVCFLPSACGVTLWNGGTITNPIVSPGATFTAPVLFPNGTVGVPSIAWAVDADGSGTGIYRGDTDAISFTTAGTTVMALDRFTRVIVKILAFGTTADATPDVFLVKDSAATLQVGQNAATATAQTFKAANSTGATIAGASLTLKGGAGTSGIANGGALILAGGANSSTGEPGAVAIADGGTKPTCAVGIRGSIWYDAGGAGVADTFEVCAKAAADTYAWRVLATIP